MNINRHNIVVGLDVGSSAIKAALGEINPNGAINILGLSQVTAGGLKKGSIIDIETTARSIDECLNELERFTGIEIESGWIAFSGNNITAVNNHAFVAVSNPNHEITPEDKERVLQLARNIALPSDKLIVQVIERQFIVDGYDGVKDPVGMVGNRLEVEVVIILAAAAAIQNLQRAAQRVNLQLEKLVYSPLLAAESVLLPAEMEMGVALVDMGGGITDISVFEQGSLGFTSVLPIGGEYITRDLAIVLRTSIEEAVRIKEKSGVASTNIAQDDIMIDVSNLQGKETKEVSQHVVADIISARVLEMAEMVFSELKQGASIDKLPGGLVLTGGGAQLKGLAEVWEDYLNIPVRLGIPDNIQGLAGDLNKPQNSVALGALIYGAKLRGPWTNEPNHGVSSVFRNMGNWLKELFA